MNRELEFKDLPNEQWKDIEGYKNIYQVSNMGRVKNVQRQRIRKHALDLGGYPHLDLNKKNKAKPFTIHRLVAKTFILNPLNKVAVNHINGIKADNRVENLEWCTNSENVLHSFRVLKRKPVKSAQGKFGKDNPRSKAVLQFSLDNKFINEFGSMKEAERHTGINNSQIGCVCRNKRNHTGKYKWKYKIN